MAIDPVSLAITVALTAANMAITASRTIEGPRISDTSATVADYGTPLNYFVGQRVLQCSCFFAKPIKEVKQQHKGKGGKQVNYTGFGTWAVCIADHEIAGISKIWFDNHLVYDTTGDGEKIYPLGDDYEGGKDARLVSALFDISDPTGREVASHMRVYLGTEDQDPDPDMQAYIEARDGAGTCPAYRGVAYIYFQLIPLENLGNRFPDVQVLTRTSTARAFPGWEYEIEVRDTCTAFKVGNPVYYASGPVAWINGAGPGPMDEVDNSAPLVRRAFRRIGPDEEIFWPGVGDGVGTWSAGIHRGNIINPGPPSPHNEMKVEVYFRHWTEAVPRLVGFSDYSTDYPDDFTWDNAIAWADFPPPEGEDAGADTHATLEQLLTLASTKAGIDPADCDWSAATQEFGGYNWTQSSFKQALEPVLDLFDTDVRPHDFKLQALPRVGASQGAISSDEFVLPDADDGSITPFTLPRAADSDLPRRVFLVYADLTADQNPNTATPPGQDPDVVGSTREMSLDMQTMALTPDAAQQLVERRHRRERFARVTSQFAVTRKRIGIEPGDVYTPVFYGDPIAMRCTKLVLGADGKFDTEWERDQAQLGVLPTSPGAPAQGYIPDTVPDVTESVGAVLDIPLLADAHDQTAPLAYLVAGPAEPGTWMGADFAQSDTGELDSFAEGWDGIGSGSGAVIGTCAGVLPDALPWVCDMGSTLSVTINAGELTSASLDDLLTDPTRNLAAVRSGDGWELVQFMNATLTDDRVYAVSGFLRGVRGTEWAIGGHAAGDRFTLLDKVVKRRTMGASEIGDTDWYILSGPGFAPDQDDAFSLKFTGASHKPYAPVHGTAVQSGADWVFDAVRRTRIGGGSLDNQDVPLGEASESWSLDILDGDAVARTIAGTSLPLTYTEADQIADFGSAQDTIAARLYQLDPTLGLRGYPLALTA